MKTNECCPGKQLDHKKNLMRDPGPEPPAELLLEIL